MNLPERINVMKVASYDVQEILDEMRETRYPDDKPLEEITVDDLLDWIAPWVSDWFGFGSNLIYQDENGNDL